ncbi:MAG: HEAT repeat domain-containing protein, partial [Gemmatimonadota bacterium]|nr:HEAT repeat domain-containing protein [Gemmatimonadota bacterium]
DLVRDVMRRVEGRTIQHPATIEAGIENSWGLDGDALKERLLLRKVDAIHVAPGATAEELRALARALADDEGTVPSSEHIRVALVESVIPGSLSAPPPQPRPAIPAPPAIPGAAGGARPQTGPRTDPENPSVLAARILAGLPVPIEREQWLRVLHDLQAVVRLVNRLPEEARRPHAITLKRVLTPRVIGALIDQAYRLTEEQARTAEVLRGGGLPVAEQVLDILRKSETLGPRAFLLDAVAGVPELFPMLSQMGKSDLGPEAWLAAELLGRLGLPEAVPILTPLVRHREERVRLAAIEALGRFSEKGVVEALRAGLTHEAPATRARAGRTLAARGSRAITMPLVAALEAEKDLAAWDALLTAIASLDAPEGPAALARMVMEPGGRLGPKGGQVNRQLAVVRALAAAPGAAARQALESIASGGYGEAQALARSLLAGG